MKEQCKELANLDIKEVTPMVISDLEIAHMKRNVINNIKQDFKFKKQWRNGIVASLVLVVVITTATTTGIATTIKGYFEDIKNSNGAVIGTQYTAGIDEINLETGTVSKSEGDYVVPIMINLNNIEEPFASMEALGLREVKLLDSSNNVIGNLEIDEEVGLRNTFSFELADEEKVLSKVTSNTDLTQVFKGNVIINYKLVTSGEHYKIDLDSLYIYKKADAPLEVIGDWQVDLSFE